MERFIIKYRWINGTVERVWRNSNDIIMLSSQHEADDYIERLRKLDGRLIFRTESVFLS